MNPLERLLAQNGKTVEDFKPKSKIGQIFHRGGVADTTELRRVLDLPTYRWQDDADLEPLRVALEEQIALPVKDCRRRCGHEIRQDDCTECQRAAEACVCRGEGIMHLRLVQVAALQALHDVGGLFGPMRVGCGKTIISFLAGVILDADRTLLLIPAKLREKTKRDFALLRRHWKAPKALHVLSYELLARDRGVAELEAFKPDLVVCDEGHKTRNPQAACTKRLRRYLNETNPDAKYVDMSGTVTKRSLLEYHHRINWALPDGFQPLPRKWTEVKDWADALDEKVMIRLKPGALLRMANDEELDAVAKDPNEALRIVRQAYGRRLLSSYGVVGTEEQFNGAMPILIQSLEFEPGSAVFDAFENLRENWELPDGQPIDSPTTLWRVARELVQGFFYRWEFTPPTEWLHTRKEWAKTVREILSRFHDIDSPLCAARAVDQGRISWATSALAAWRAIKDTYEPTTVAEWIDDACLNFVASRDTELIWCHEVAFAERLSQETGLPYYGQLGLCNGKPIEAERGRCIASIAANSEGRNLQHFSKNLIVSCPPGGSTMEQLLGRTHRDGQEADEVEVDVILACYEQWDVFRQARRDAEYIERTTRQCQKLNFADITVQTEEQIALRHENGDPLWNKKNAQFFLDKNRQAQ